jgi:hypothetical protein
MSSTPITGALVVCVAAAGVAAGALFLDAGGASAPSSANTNANGSNPAAATDDGGYGSGGGGGTPAAQGATLEISGFQFGAVTVDLDGGGTASFTAPGDPGSYDFQCQIHPEMSGTLTVN